MKNTQKIYGLGRLARMPALPAIGLIALLIVSIPNVRADTAKDDDRFAQALAAFDEASAATDQKHEGFERAYAIWSELAEAGDTRANYHMGIMNMYGIGGAEFEQRVGIRNVRLAAENGYPIAQSLMGFMVERSDGTYVKTGDELALSWWRKGAEGNHCTAIRRMAAVYEKGELGVEADPAKSAEWTARLAGCRVSCAC